MTADGAGAVPLVGGRVGGMSRASGLVRRSGVKRTGSPAGMFRRRTMGPRSGPDMTDDGTKGMSRRGDGIGTMGNRTRVGGGSQRHEIEAGIVQGDKVGTGGRSNGHDIGTGAGVTAMVDTLMPRGRL